MFRDAYKTPLKTTKSSKPPLTLTTIPEKLTLKILDFCDYPSMASLHKVSHSLRGFIDETLPKPPIHKLLITFEEDLVLFDMYLSTNRLPYPHGGLVNIRYSNQGRDTVVSRLKGDGEKTRRQLGEVNFLERFFQDFLMVLKHYRTPLECFEVCGSDTIQNRTLKKYLKFFVEKMSKRKIQAKQVWIASQEVFVFDLILPLMDPGTLRKITLENTFPVTEIRLSNGFLRSEQWRKAKELEIYGRGTFGFETMTISRFTKVEGTIRGVGLEDVMAMKEACHRCGPPKHFRLIFHRFLDDIRDSDVLGPHFSDQTKNTDNWFYSSPGTKKILHIRTPFYQHHQRFPMLAERDNREKILEVKFIDKSKVPNGAVIQQWAQDDI